MESSVTGYRQKALMRVLEGHSGPLPLGYLARVSGDDAANNLVYTAQCLRVLVDRGLVVKPRRGWYEAAA